MGELIDIRTREVMTREDLDERDIQSENQRELVEAMEELKRLMASVGMSTDLESMISVVSSLDDTA